MQAAISNYNILCYFDYSSFGSEWNENTFVLNYILAIPIGLFVCNGIEYATDCWADDCEAPVVLHLFDFAHRAAVDWVHANNFDSK